MSTIKEKDRFTSNEKRKLLIDGLTNSILGSAIVYLNTRFPTYPRVVFYAGIIILAYGILTLLFWCCAMCKMPKQFIDVLVEKEAYCVRCNQNCCVEVYRYNRGEKHERYLQVEYKWIDWWTGAHCTSCGFDSDVRNWGLNFTDDLFFDTERNVPSLDTVPTQSSTSSDAISIREIDRYTGAERCEKIRNGLICAVVGAVVLVFVLLPLLRSKPISPFLFDVIIFIGSLFVGVGIVQILYYSSIRYKKNIKVLCVTDAICPMCKQWCRMETFQNKLGDGGLDENQASVVVGIFEYKTARHHCTSCRHVYDDTGKGIVAAWRKRTPWEQLKASRTRDASTNATTENNSNEENTAALSVESQVELSQADLPLSNGNSSRRSKSRTLS